MFVMHVALGGCLKAPPIEFGLSEDTGGHIAYVMGAALHQAILPEVSRVEVVTRAFDTFGAQYAQSEKVNPKLLIRRLATDRKDYLSKDGLWQELAALTRALWDRLEENPRPDIIHAHFADAAEISFLAAKRFGIPVVYTPHSLALDKGGLPDYRRINAERAAIRDAAAIIVSSRDEAERQVTAYDSAAIGRVHRISPGVADGIATASTERAAALIAPFLDDPEKPMILAIARPVEKKNLASLVRAYAGNRPLRDAANLVILAGQHQTAEHEAAKVIAELKASGVNLGGCFALPAAHDSQHVTGLYRLAAQRRGVFVNPAFFEPFGLTLLEAAAAGLPVVATCHGGPSRILADLDHGILVDPKNGDAISAACLELLTSPDHWSRASRNALRGIGAFSWSRYAEESVAVYRSTRRHRCVPLRARRLIVCDIDNTLTGCRSGASEFSQWIALNDSPFIVATGRSLPEARAVLRQWNLPEPQAFITSVGTEIFLDHFGVPTLWQDHADRISNGWDRDAIQALLQALDPEWQGAVDQKQFKLSLFGNSEAAARIRLAIAGSSLAARVIHSHDRLIDVLPECAGKASAVAMLAERYGLTLQDCVAAGDSGNDYDMLDACGTAIVVGNAGPELQGLLPRPGLLRVRAAHAGGVLEGLRAAGIR